DISPPSLHDALPISWVPTWPPEPPPAARGKQSASARRQRDAQGVQETPSRELHHGQRKDLNTEPARNWLRSAQTRRTVLHEAHGATGANRSGQAGVEWKLQHPRPAGPFARSRGTLGTQAPLADKAAQGGDD